MNPSIQTAEQFMNRLRIIFFALSVGPLCLFLVAYLEHKSGSAQAVSEDNPMLGIFQAVAALFTATAITGAFFIYKKMIASARQMGTLAEKLEGLFRTGLLKYAMLESACLFNGVVFYVFGHPAFTVLFVISLMALTYSTPSTQTVIADLRLNKKEGNIMRQGYSLYEEEK